MNTIDKFINSRRSNLLASITLFLILYIKGVNFYTSLGISLTFFSFLSFIRYLGNSLPIIELMLFLCGYQWIVASYYSYLNGDPYYPMSVTENVYMSITVLLYLGLIIGLNYKKKELTINKESIESYLNQPKIKKFAFFLIITSIGANLGKAYFPNSLLFINHLISSLMYVGAIMLLYTSMKSRWYIFIAIFGFLVIKVVISGVFNEVLSWGFFLLMFFANILKFSKSKILLIILCSFFFLGVLQSVKPYYRSLIWNGYNGNRLTLFIEVFINNITDQNQKLNSSELGIYDELNSRVNQGWVYSKVYNHVPQNIPYANGETILDAIKDSFLPRFIFTNKKPTFSRDLFEKYTGRVLNSSTAMGLGIVGEAYANFSKWGGFIFMIFYGAFINFLIRVYNRKIILFPILLFFVPMYFEMIIRAISNFSQVINWQIKVAVFIWLLIKFYNKFVENLPKNNIT